MKDWLARAVRTLMQLVAGGALTALVNQFAADIDPQWTPYVLAGFTLLVAFAQNMIEDQTGKALLKPDSPPASKAVETVAKV